MGSPAILLARNYTALVNQFRRISSIKLPTSTHSECLYKEPNIKDSLLFSPICRCGLYNKWTISHMSTSTNFCTNKTIGKEYEYGKLIYFGSKNRLVKRVQLALYGMGAVIVFPLPYVLTIIDQEFAKYVYTIWAWFFGVINPLMFSKFCKRYVFELYYNKENDIYTAITPTLWVFGKSRLLFTAKDCSMPDKPTAFASFLVNKRPLLVSSDNMDYFQYSRMLRYACDLDYENPDRQSQYEETLQDALSEMEKQKPKKQSSE